MNSLKAFFSHKITLFVVKAGLAFIFIVASLGKIMDPESFARDVYSYVLLPPFIVPLFARVVPWIEAIAGLCLILDIYPRSSALIITALLVSFIGAIGIDIYRGIEIECGCFDFLFPQEKIGLNTIIRDAVMILMAIPVLIFDHNEARFYGLKLKK